MTGSGLSRTEKAKLNVHPENRQSEATTRNWDGLGFLQQSMRKQKQ